MIVVSDTTPIISLMKAGQLELLQNLFDVVYIPEDEKQSDVLLMDERKGRQVAKKMGITITGTIGILIQAFDEGILTKEDVDRCIERLNESRIRISEKLYQRLRKNIGKRI